MHGIDGAATDDRRVPVAPVDRRRLADGNVEDLLAARLGRQRQGAGTDSTGLREETLTVSVERTLRCHCSVMPAAMPARKKFFAPY